MSFLTKNKKQTPLQVFRKTTRYPVEPVFSLAGRVYYAFSDINNMPAGRTLAALPLYVQMATNCDEKFLTLYWKTFESVLNDPASINVEKLVVLKNQIKDRAQWAFTPDLVYKYASVVYFDENENPSTYDAGYAERTIAFWKQHAGVMDFFLTEPITTLIPALSGLGESFPSYLNVVLKAHQLQIQNLLQMLYSDRTLTPEDSNYKSAITDYLKQSDLENYPLTNTSFSSPKNYQYLKN